MDGFEANAEWRAEPAILSPGPRPMDVALVEFHHRWFNSLTALGCSLRSCAMVSKSVPDMLARLGDIDLQIQAMASLHRRLHQPLPVGGCLQTYCSALADDVVTAFGRGDIEPWVDMCDVSLSPDAFVTLGNLVVELVTNAVKHGRAPASGGLVWMRLRRRADGRLELNVTDNFAAPAEAPRTPRIIANLVELLGGELLIRTRSGYATRIVFSAQ